jgi:glucans biosynthesis protein
MPLAVSIMLGGRPKALEKTRAGAACQGRPVAGRKRCRLHGGLSPGAPRGSRNGNYRRGDWTTEAIEERRWLRSPRAGLIVGANLATG